MLAPVLASIGASLPLIIGIALGLGWLTLRNRSTTCPHCGHDSGVSIWSARVCPACGRRRDKRIGKSRK